MRETYHTRQERGDYNQEKEDIDDSGYFSSNDLSVKESEEVTDSNFYAHLFDKNDRKLPLKDLPTPHNDLKSLPEDVMSVNDQLKSPSGLLEGTEADGDLLSCWQRICPTLHQNNGLVGTGLH